MDVVARMLSVIAQTRLPSDVARLWQSSFCNQMPLLTQTSDCLFRA